MDYIIELFKSTVAILIAMRIAVVAGLLLIVVRLIYNFIHTSHEKKVKMIQKKHITRYMDLLKH
jgi:hypothetical protein